MELTIEYTTNEYARDQIQTYWERVGKLLDLIKPWLLEERLEVVEESVDVIESLGRYRVTQLLIKTSEGATLANFQPLGALVLVGEGVVQIDGWLGRETLIYMIKDALQLTKPSRTDNTKLITYPMYKGIEVNGWYWIEDSRRNSARFLDKPLLLNLITLVSDYEF
jgi:hypothetical protein